MIPFHNIIWIFSQYMLFVQGALEDPAQSSDSCLLLLPSHSRVKEPTWSKLKDFPFSALAMLQLRQWPAWSLWREGCLRPRLPFLRSLWSPSRSSSPSSWPGTSSTSSSSSSLPPQVHHWSKTDERLPDQPSMASPLLSLHGSRCLPRAIVRKSLRLRNHQWV